MKFPIPYGRHHITDDDIHAVIETLKSDFITQGPKINELEKSFCETMGSTYAVAVANGTAALHLACLALDLSPGDRIITSPITFVASANCALYCGADVTFVDIDPETYLIDIKKIQQLLENSPAGTFKGIVAIDFAGLSIKSNELKKLAEKFNLWIIEDASHAPGATFTDENNCAHKVGGHSFADLTTFSFHPVKHIAAGEGGMITTNNRPLYEKLMLLRSHGMMKDQSKLINPPHGAWYHEMQALGYNYRICDIQAALANSQLKRLNENVNKRNELAQVYDRGLSDLPLVLPKRPSQQIHAFHLYIVQTEFRNDLFNYLQQKMIQVQVHYLPIPMQPYYQKLGHTMDLYPVAADYYKKCLSLPLYDSLSNEEQMYVINEIRNFFRQ